MQQVKLEKQITCPYRPRPVDYLPEEKLVLAVLVQAIYDIIGRGGMGGARQERDMYLATEWLFENKKTDVFSFSFCAEVLGMDPCVLRQRIIAYRNVESKKYEDKCPFKNATRNAFFRELSLRRGFTTAIEE